MPNFVHNLLKNIAVELNEEFDRNFERKAFFDQAWDANTKIPNHKGSLMARTNALRRSLFGKMPNIKGTEVSWESSLPYANIQNEGGEVKVTQAMKRYFWARYYQASGAMTTTKSGSASNSQRNQRLTKEAAIWKAMALKKVGSTIKIPSRRFIGNHPQVNLAVQRVAKEDLKELENYMNNHWKKI